MRNNTVVIDGMRLGTHHAKIRGKVYYNARKWEGILDYYLQ